MRINSPEPVNFPQTSCLPSTAPTKQDHGVFLVFFGSKPMWIDRTAILARSFDCTPEIFDETVFTLASLGAVVQVRLTKQASEN